MKIENSININANYDLVFDVSNDIENWPNLFNEYGNAEILEREENKITFRLTNKDGNSWISWRVFEKENGRCYAERVDPKYPFKYMNLEWLYEVKDEGIDMIWKQDFEMDEKAPLDDFQARDRMNEHSKKNMKLMKDVIEKMYQESKNSVSG